MLPVLFFCQRFYALKRTVAQNYADKSSQCVISFLDWKRSWQNSRHCWRKLPRTYFFWQEPLEFLTSQKTRLVNTIPWLKNDRFYRHCFVHRFSNSQLPNCLLMNSPEELQVYFLCKWFDKPSKNQFYLIRIKAVDHFFQVIASLEIVWICLRTRCLFLKLFMTKGTRSVLVLSIFWWCSSKVVQIL